MRKRRVNILITVAIIFIISISASNATLFVKNDGFSPTYYSEPWQGFTLFAPEYSTMTYLMDINKNIVHTWESEYIQGLAAYLLEDGSLIRSCLPYANPTFMCGGITGRVEIISWAGEQIWEFEYSSDQVCMHHDLEVLPNGNVLMIAWEYKTYSQAVQAGRNPSNIPFSKFFPDKIIEVKPTGPTSGDIVWEWHAWDHLIQDFDSSKNNYGVVGDHPELIDINNFYGAPDWMHSNSVDYNEEFDQIMLSVHNFNELWIIDHSTTTFEAKGHTGGNSGKGGDLLYRWGNPAAYHAGSLNDQKLFGQHDAQWIKEGFPGEGSILVFNNGWNRPDGQYSTVDEFIPPVDNNGFYHKDADTAYGPLEQLWIYADEDPTDFFAGGISGASRLPNGNTLICHGPNGYFFEVTNEKDIIWDYTNPYPTYLLNAVFKIQRYSPGYSGLSNLILGPEKPNKPKGPTSNLEIGIEYFYSSSTTDPQEDQIFYLFDWGDGTDSGWLGPHNTGDIAEASHIWTKKLIYDIRVKAKDVYGYESTWSNPLRITLPIIRDSNSHSIFIDKIIKMITAELPIFKILFNLK